MKTLSFLILSALLGACAHKAPSSPVLEVPKAKLVSEDVQAVSAPVNRVADSNSQLKGQVGILKDQARSARQQAESAMNEAERLVKAGRATQQELDELWKSLQGVQSRNLFLETELVKTSALLDDQSVALRETQMKLTVAVSSAGSADQAAQYSEAQLRSVTNQFVTAKTEAESLGKLVAVKDDRISALQGWLAKAVIALGFVALYVVSRFVKLTPWGRPWLFWLP